MTPKSKDWGSHNSGRAYKGTDQRDRPTSKSRFAANGRCSQLRPFLFQKNLEKAGTVDFKKHPARKVGTRSWQCGRKVPGRFPFPGARNPRFVAFRDSGNFFQQSSRDFPLRTPEQTPETATAFSSFLTLGNMQETAEKRRLL